MSGVVFSSLKSRMASVQLYRDLQNLLSQINSMTTLDLQGQINTINTNTTSNTNAITTLTTRVAALEAKKLQCASLTTNASGRVTWTYPTPYVNTPVLSTDIRASVGQPYAIRTISISNTAVTLEVLASPVITVVGISVIAPLAVVGSGINVNIIGMEP